MNGLPQESRFAPAFLALFLLALLIGVFSHERQELEPEPAPQEFRLPLRLVGSDFSPVIQAPDSVLPIVYNRPPSLAGLSIPERKQRFLDVMLPAVVLEHARLKRLASRIRQDMKVRPRAPEEQQFLDSLMSLYKVSDLPSLLRRVKPHPPSLVLAQAAIESGWGRSRFFKEAANAFGIWAGSSTGATIKARGSRDGKSVHLRSYANLLEGVADYYRVLATGPYRDFRMAREHGEDPLSLARHLDRYSEKGKAYTRSLVNVIEHNNLLRFDQSRLVGDPVHQRKGSGQP
jgi:Bax protein